MMQHDISTFWYHDQSVFLYLHIRGLEKKNYGCPSTIEWKRKVHKVKEEKKGNNIMTCDLKLRNF